MAGAKPQVKVALHVRFMMFWVRHLQQGIASLGELWRTPASSMLTLAVIGVCLALPASFYLATKNVQQLTSYWKSDAQISLFLKQNISEAQRDSLQKNIASMRQVASVELVTKQQGLVEFQENSGFEDVLALLPDNPLPDVLLVLPSQDFNSASAAKTLLDSLQEHSLVDEGRLDVEWLQRLDTIVSMLQQAAWLLIILLLTAVALIVSNTLRLNILSRRSEIEVMKLVGATDAFIQRPFLYTGFWFGLVGGLMAWVLCNILLIWTEYALQQIGLLYQQDIYLSGLDLQEFGSLMLFATLLGLIASWFSVNRHIKQIEPS
ncbi:MULTISPECIES: permease-like cell division protein FtsX [unclassified Agarivorans]|uniref:permease-like cell division protein FtsX n=1 Tax=unclassified Agarivorans TaxID=2636026 RepID=UPI0010E22730|nr:MULTISPECIES: permease-like cell division protein FtsX [unclassified Agarivorans]MDO6687495.1 permease-like cell division protein FtsX [Agarivorans sp. 3_MG-2023]MDO6715261.1 permease-like cell division protein FtsX [Agarivorans sp. 2_MG-2023]MDO6763442.1 permease-like cell division protein FtsX [Agarivorans sp. 1_MG-2023]GDY26274.1 cell division protein FtsX [Agarivorans sp. Toyoura001]